MLEMTVMPQVIDALLIVQSQRMLEDDQAYHGREILRGSPVDRMIAVRHFFYWQK
jgi:hypothetical protein